LFKKFNQLNHKNNQSILVTQTVNKRM